MQYRSCLLYTSEKETITGKEFMKIYRREKGIPEPEETETPEEARPRISENTPSVTTADIQKTQDAPAQPQEEIVPKPWDLHFQQTQNSAPAGENTAGTQQMPAGQQPMGQTPASAGEANAAPAGNGSDRPDGNDWWSSGESGIPGQDLNFFRTKENGNGSDSHQEGSSEQAAEMCIRDRFFGALAGAVVYSLGINLFIVPVALYSLSLIHI